MKIVILAGGTGSIALQTGLYEMLDKRIDGVDTKILVNAYDNGLSTGSVRRVCGGHILGPSDVRKNQTTRLKLENPDSPWNNFLDIRFTRESSQARSFCLEQIETLFTYLSIVDLGHKLTNKQLLIEAVETYFNTPIASKIDYNDFSLANIVYAGFAKANGNSLRAAAKTMALLMGIKDNVILNDDTSLFLGAVTASGIRVTDEGDIVSWGDANDPFVDLFFTDAAGRNTQPVLCQEASDALLAADLIILSSGTQWSSLIPTYESVGFKQIIQHCLGKIVMVMNRQPDKDSPGQTASDIINILVPRYFSKGQLNVILDNTGHAHMATLDACATSHVASVNTFSLDNPNENAQSITKHNATKLAHAIAQTYFRGYTNSEHFMFDYDDTLVGRGNTQPRSSELNRQLLMLLKNTTGVSVCTGNSIKGISLRCENRSVWSDEADYPYSTLTVFADGGINKYEYNTIRIEGDDVVKPKFLTCVHPTSIFKKEGICGIDNIISTLKDHGIPLSKIENRGDVIISIKPIDDEYRPVVLSLVQLLLKGAGLEVRATGRTTIDISHPSVSKAAAVSYILSEGVDSITFIGDEFSGGNDAPVLQMQHPRVKCLPVKDPAETSFFLLTLLQQLKVF